MKLDDTCAVLSTDDLQQGLNVCKLSSFAPPSRMTSPLSDVFVRPGGLGGGSEPGFAGSNHTRGRRYNGRDVSYCLIIPVWQGWGGMQQKYLQVVSEEELKVWEEGEVQQREGEAWSLPSRGSGLHPDLEGL